LSKYDDFREKIFLESDNFGAFFFTNNIFMGQVRFFFLSPSGENSPPEKNLKNKNLVCMHAKLLLFDS
jgi:hypothetical protein